ncbi:hypothetical protein F2Q68_00046186 [Brassica cretica]|uniref:Uncharacterized protein n=1 Tax=Brassica cretica TaxID=69181 RepID=A0A8S9LPD3_BRACR|nr:hypothetical protein F2Q68_00046186 [Brassica cretica]
MSIEKGNHEEPTAEERWSSREKPVPKIELAAMDFTVLNITDTRLSAKWDVSIRIPYDLPGRYICLQGDFQASFMYKDVTLATSSPQNTCAVKIMKGCVEVLCPKVVLELSTPTKLSIQLLNYGHDKPDVTSISMDQTFAAYLHNKFLSSGPNVKENPRIYLNRNKRKNGEDQVKISNGLECKITCSSSKVSYVFDTEDVLHRVKRKKVLNQSRQDPVVASGSSIRQRRIQSYQKLLTGQ